MENKLVIFDLDGVLIDSRMIHYHALNKAIGEIAGWDFTISINEHCSTYDGLPTSVKLKKLSAEKGLPEFLHQKIADKKQDFTVLEYSNKSADNDLAAYMEMLKYNNIQIAVASNSVRKTLKQALLQLGIMQYVDYYVSNEDVKWNKPFPEMYWRCMIALKTLPKNTVIIEDSHIGREAALASGAHLVAVKDRSDLTPAKIHESIALLDSKISTVVPWLDKTLNVLIPMAGAGSRFAQAGYTFPKPLIDVNGKPMIQVVVENLNIDANFIFIVQKEHYEKYNLQYLLNAIKPGCSIVIADGMTEGAACTTLLASKYIDSAHPLLIANSDQFMEWDSNKTLYAFTAAGVDAGIVTFESLHPKWSYVRLGDDGFVQEVAEKKVISNLATTGVYYWSHGWDYLRYANQMIEKDIRTNGEFYVCPVFNEAIADGKKVRAVNINQMWGIGTPEDLRHFLENYKKGV